MKGSFWNRDFYIFSRREKTNAVGREDFPDSFEIGNGTRVAPDSLRVCNLWIPAWGMNIRWKLIGASLADSMRRFNS